MDDKCRCRGEPVAWLRSDELRKLGHPYSDAPLNSKTDSMMLHAKGTQEAAAKYGHDVPVFTAPQPRQIPDGFEGALAQEIRRVDGKHSLGAGALAEALMPFLSRAMLEAAPEPKGES